MRARFRSVKSAVSTMTMPPSRTSGRFTLRAAGFMATSTSGWSPGVAMSVLAKWSWKLETPGRVPAGARISAGKLGSVAMSLPNVAVSAVKRSPVNCMPSPESPAKRITTWSSVRTSVIGPLCRRNVLRRTRVVGLSTCRVLVRWVSRDGRPMRRRGDLLEGHVRALWETRRMRSYREILTIPGAWQFSAAGLLARAGGAMMGIGTVLMVSALYGSYGLAGALAATNVVSWAIGTAVLSNLVDRYGQRRVMYPAAVISAAALTLVVVFALLGLPAWTLFPPALISGLTGGSPGALVRARWNNVITKPEQLHTAYALESTLDELTFVIGPVAATALSTQVHPAAALIAPVVLGLVGAQLFYSQRATEPPPAPRRDPAADRPALLSRLILLVPGVGSVIAVNMLIGCVFGSIDVSVVAAATGWNVRGASGAVLAVFSLASGIAGFFYGARAWSSPLTKRFLVGVVLLFAFSAALPFTNSIVTIGAVGVLVGATVAPTLINGNSLVGRLVPQGRLTEGLSWMGTGIGIGVSIGSSVSGQVIDDAGYHGGLVTVVVFSVLAAVIALASSRTLHRAAARGDARLLAAEPS